ncbi:probable mitochondrial pyruvate carrier 2 isoform X2 [Ostrea edulis]|uniref:probable mitochondrial pyruvate carrier 2 isoform X2 n=1 Tax=Ostrea edulis TaxID=37623 RepID=UPI0020941EC0|nr:probable mitochondrial pyruvate carrier 2 isoform X2 [Ostrea edulis]
MSSRLYLFVIRTVDKFVPPRLQPLWNHEIGPKTIFFWAPLVKWILVGAGIGDLTRPAENISLFQSSSMLSGYIWTRWCFIIQPKNLNLALINFLVAVNGTIQCVRVCRYKKSVGKPLTFWD